MRRSAASPSPLTAAGAGHAGAGELAAGLCRRLSAWYERWLADGFAPVRAALLPWIALFGHPVRVTAGSETLDATAQDLDESGRLIVRLESGLLRPLDAGEVQLLR